MFYNIIFLSSHTTLFSLPLSANNPAMKVKFYLFVVFVSLLLIGCSSQGSYPPCDKAWAVTKGENKQSVRSVMESQNLLITDEDSVLIAFDVDGICWCGERWDMASVKFDTKDKAVNVNLVKGMPMDNLTCEEVADFLQSLYGTLEYDPDLSIWTFRGNEYTKAFMVQYPRTMISVTWDISK